MKRTPPLVPYSDAHEETREAFDAAAEEYWGTVSQRVRCTRCGRTFGLNELLISYDVPRPMPYCPVPPQPDDPQREVCAGEGWDEIRPAPVPHRTRDRRAHSEAIGSSGVEAAVPPEAMPDLTHPLGESKKKTKRGARKRKPARKRAR